MLCERCLVTDLQNAKHEIIKSETVKSAKH